MADSRHPAWKKLFPRFLLAIIYATMTNLLVYSLAAPTNRRQSPLRRAHSQLTSAA